MNWARFFWSWLPVAPLLASSFFLAGGNGQAEKKRLAITTGFAGLWDIESGKQRANFQEFDSISGKLAAFSPDGKTVTFAGGTTVFGFDCAKGKRVLEIQGDFILGSMAYAPVENLLALGDFEGLITIHSLNNNKKKKYFWDTKFKWHLGSIAFPKDGRTLVLGGGYRMDKPGKVEFLDVATFKVVGKLDLPAPISQVGFSRNGKWLGLGGLYLKVKVYDWETKKEKYALDGLGPLAFSWDNKTLATSHRPGDSSRPGGINFWDLATGKKIGPKISEVAADQPKCLAFSPDGKILASGWMHELILFDTANGKVIRKLELPPGKPTVVEALAFSPDGKTIAATGWSLNEAKPKQAEK